METAGAKFPQPILDRIDEYADERDINRSEAIRQLVKSGIAAEEGDGFKQPFSIYMAWLGTLAAAAGLLDASEIVGIGGAVLFALAVAYHATQNGPLFSNG